MCWNMCKSLKAGRYILCTWERVQRLWNEESTEMWGLFLFGFGSRRFWIWYFKLILSGGVKTPWTTDWSERILTRINIFTTQSNPSYLVSCTLMEYFPNSLFLLAVSCLAGPSIFWNKVSLFAVTNPIPSISSIVPVFMLCWRWDHASFTQHHHDNQLRILLKLKGCYMKWKT